MTRTPKPRVVRYREFPPHAALRDLVRCYWVLEAAYPRGSAQDVHPDGCVELIFNFGSPYLRDGDGRPEPLPEATVVGFQNRTIRFGVNGTVKIVAARLRPWGALLFMKDDAGGLSDTVGGVDGRWTTLAKRLGRAVRAGRYGKAVEDLEAHLLRREISRTYYLHVIREAAEHLRRTKGHCSIGDLADRCRLGMRQIQRGFRRVVGASPKAYARAVRFDRAMGVLMTDRTVGLARIAHESGYADQAHFTRDFKELSGQTPSRYVRTLRALWDSLRHEDVVFLQDPPSGPS